MSYRIRSLISNQVLVAIAGTQVPLAASKTLVSRVKIRALTGNTGVVYIGDSTVGPTTGYPLAAGVELTPSDIIGNEFDVIDLNKIYVDADVAADGVSLLYFS